MYFSLQLKLKKIEMLKKLFQTVVATVMTIAKKKKSVPVKP